MPETVAKPPKGKKGKARKHVYMNQMVIGDTHSGEYYVKERSYDKTVNGDEFTIINIGDKSGFKEARGWERFEIKPGYVKAVIKVNEYKGKISYIISTIKNIDEPSDDDIFDVSVDNLDSEIEKFIASLRGHEEKIKEDFVNYVPIQSTMKNIFTKYFPNNGAIEKYGLLPYTEDSVYGKKGGVALRINTLIQFVESMENIYDLGCIELSCLKTAIFIHLIGCYKCYEIRDCASFETKHCKLYGFEKSTLMNLDREMNGDIKDADVYERIVHCISSQYPNYRMKPKTLEAIIFSRVTLLDDEVTHAVHCIDSDETDSEFTAFDWVNKKQYYKA